MKKLFIAWIVLFGWTVVRGQADSLNQQKYIPEHKPYDKDGVPSSYDKTYDTIPKQTANAQQPKLDWNLLTGKWECQKVIFSPKPANKSWENHTGYWHPYFLNFSPNQKFKEEYFHGKEKKTLSGKYTIDKEKNTISFSEVIETTEYGGHPSGKYNLSIISLTTNALLAQIHYIPITYNEDDYEGNYYFSFRKLKKITKDKFYNTKWTLLKVEELKPEYRVEYADTSCHITMNIDTNLEIFGFTGWNKYHAFFSFNDDKWCEIALNLATKRKGKPECELGERVLDMFSNIDQYEIDKDANTGKTRLILSGYSRKLIFIKTN